MVRASVMTATPVGIRLRKLSALSMLLLSACNMRACGEGASIPDATTAQQHMLMRYPSQAVISEDQIDAYLDYSAGMGEGMRASADVFDRLKNFLGGRRVTYYRVAAAPEPTVIDINSPEANFVNLANFTDRGSRLNVPLLRIAGSPNRTAIFVTDFERIDDVALRQILPGAPGPHPIDASAWGQTPFRRWLEGGNRLDVFARRFAKPDSWFDSGRSAKYQNWVYTLVFTPAGDVTDPARFKGSVLSYLLDDHAKTGSSDFRHFAFWAGGITVARVNDASNGNANPNAPPQTFTTDSLTLPPHEYYEFKAEDLLALREDASFRDKRFLSGVKLTLSIPVLKTVIPGIQVTDVTSALGALGTAAAAPPAAVDTNPETGVVTVQRTAPNPNYDNGEPTADVFEFVRNASTNEIGIKLSPNFSGVETDRYYRVAVVLKDVAADPVDDTDDVLSLQYLGGYKISALRESLRLATRDVAAGMKDREVYVFYIKILK